MKTMNLPYAQAKALTEIGTKGQYYPETKTMDITFNNCDAPTDVDCELAFNTNSYANMQVTELETIWINCSRRNMERYWVIRFYTHADGYVSAKTLFVSKIGGVWSANQA